MTNLRTLVKWRKNRKYWICPVKTCYGILAILHRLMVNWRVLKLTHMSSIYVIKISYLVRWMIYQPSEKSLINAKGHFVRDNGQYFTWCLYEKITIYTVDAVCKCHILKYSFMFFLTASVTNLIKIRKILCYECCCPTWGSVLVILFNFYKNSRM